MIDQAAKVGQGVKASIAYVVMKKYLDHEKKLHDDYIGSLKKKLPEYRVTIMCDGWTSSTRESIINFMV